MEPNEDRASCHFRATLTGTEGWATVVSGLRWIGPEQGRSPSGLVGGITPVTFFCQGEGRGFESRRPLCRISCAATDPRRVRGGGAASLPMSCPWLAHDLPMVRRWLGARCATVAATR